MLQASLKARESLWLEPAAESANETLAVEFRSLAESDRLCEFMVGRGGVCFRSSRMYPEDTLVGLSLSFAEDGLQLDGQGRVRWCAVKDERIGVEFVYLTPECREWVLAKMAENEIYSFIPSCGLG